MTTEDTRDIAVEARTLAREHKDRINGLDEAVIAMREDISMLRDAVAKLSTKLGIGAGLGGLIGSGGVAVLIHYLGS